MYKNKREQHLEQTFILFYQKTKNSKKVLIVNEKKMVFPKVWALNSNLRKNVHTTDRTNSEVLSSVHSFINLKMILNRKLLYRAHYYSYV